MADSAPDQKVEDVLSSVRRLVSQEIPKRNTSKPAPRDPGALVLTSKDRIEADPKARHDTRSLEERIAELEAAVDNTTAEFEPDGSEDQSLHRPDRIVYSRPRPNEETRRRRTTLRLSEIALIETGPAQEPEPEDVPQVAFRHEPSRPRPQDEAPMAEDVPTLPAASAELHAFSDDPDDVVARIEARIERGEEAPLVLPPESAAPEPSPEMDEDKKFSAALSAAVAASRLDEAATQDDRPDDGDTLSPLEVREASIASQDAGERQDGVISGPADATRRATPIGGSDRADLQSVSADVSSDAPEAHDAPAEEKGEPSPTPETVAETALDALPTEDALRLLVARLMREELQGKLGERITHNVRKLVRREVKRVLEARNLD